MTRRALAPAVALSVALATVVRPSLAQSSASSRVGEAKRFALRILPRVGDTLRMGFEQVVRSAGPSPVNAPAQTRTSAMRVRSRSVVERVDDAGAVVLTVTDSATFDAPDVDPRQIDAARRAMKGRWARMRVTQAGAMELIGAQPNGGGSDAFTRLPGTLPEGPVPVGATWTREMALPWDGAALAGGGQGGRLQVLFRLDSVAAGGTLAFVSMHGSLARSGTGQGGARVATSGTMNGFLRVDLRRGWMTDSRATFTMVSTLTPGRAATKSKPMQLKVTITQRLHCDE